MQQALEDLSLKLMELGTFESYETVFDRLPKDKGDFHVLRYALAIYNNAETKFFMDTQDLALVGGYAILSHFVDQFGEDQMTRWRGSHDVDMILHNGPTYRDMIFQGFEIHENMKSLALPNKRVVQLYNDRSEKPVEIDLYLGTGVAGESVKVANFDYNTGVWERSKQIPVFGINVTVPSLDDLMCMKADIKEGKTGQPRPKDKQDIVTLLGLHEKNYQDASLLTENISPERFAVIEAVGREYLEALTSDIIRQSPTGPSKSYVSDLKNIGESHK